MTERARIADYIDREAQRRREKASEPLLKDRSRFTIAALALEAVASDIRAGLYEVDDGQP